MNDQASEPAGDSTETERFPVDVARMLADESDEFSTALILALKDYKERGGDITEDEVSITILVTDGNWTGASDPFNVYLDNYLPPVTLTFEREGREPVVFSLRCFMYLAAILEQAGIELAENERVYDAMNNEIGHTDGFYPENGNETFTIQTAKSED